MSMNQHGNLSFRGSICAISFVSFLVVLLIAVVLMAVPSVVGFSSRTSIYPTEELVRAFVSNDVVNLCLGVPILLGSMWLTRRGKPLGLLCWPDQRVRRQTAIQRTPHSKHIF